MAPQLKNVFDDFGKLYQGLNTSNRIIIGVILSLVVFGFGYLIFFADMVDYDYLYTNI